MIARPHHTLHKLAFALTACIGFTAAQAAMTREEVKAQHDRIEAGYKADKTACDGRSGNAKDVCMKEAQAKEKVAKAQLDADRTGKASDMEKVAKVKADTAYDVAKEKCDDLTGNAKDVCVKDAKAGHTQALADVKMQKTDRKAANEARDDKNDAAYKAQAERCDSLAGDAKDACVKEAKAKYGKS